MLIVPGGNSKSAFLALVVYGPSPKFCLGVGLNQATTGDGYFQSLGTLKTEKTNLNWAIWTLSWTEKPCKIPCSIL